MIDERTLNAIRRRRKYAGFFDWPDRRVKESAIVQRLSEALQAAGEPGFIGVQAQESDPPDCVAVTECKERIAVEVTELVDEQMARVSQHRPGLHRDWTPPEVISRLQEIIEAKDVRCTGLGKYDRVLLLVHTDEVFLQGDAGDAVREAINGHTFRKPTYIDDVIFLVSYDPRLGTYPFSRLRLGRRSFQEAG